MKRYIPSAVIFGLVMLIAACAPSPPPITVHPPPVYRIPAVVPVQICEHYLIPGWRFEATVPESGLYAYAWQLSNGLFAQNKPYWYNAGDTFRVETTSTFHVLWTPEAVQGAVFHVVSPDIVPVQTSEQICPDF